MARNNNTIEATINIGADISAFQSNIKTIQNELNRLNLSSGMRDDFNNIFKNLDTEIKNIQQKTSSGKLLAVDEKSVARSFEKIGQLWTSMTNKISSNKVSGKWLEEDQKAFDNLTALAKQYSQTIKKTDSDVMKLSRALTTEEKEQKKINKSLEEQRSIQKELSERLAGKDDVKTLNEKLEAQKQFVAQLKEEKREAEKTLKNFQKETPEQYRERFKSEHGTARGWNSAYAKEEKAAIEGVTQATQKLNVARQEEVNLKKQLSTTSSETENLQRTTSRIDQLEKRASEAQEKIRLLKEDLNTAKATAFQEVVNQLQKMKDINWDKYGIDPSTITSYDELSKVIEKIREKGGPEAEQTINKITVAMNTAQAANNGAQASFNATGKSLDQLTERGKEIDSLRSRITYFFSIGNAVRLFKRAIRSAMETVKDLDKVMTETAVVTEFSVGDMWTQLPEYTRRANELGVSIHDVYEASTLYYQQGLQTNEVMAVTNATLRMARIAGLEAAEATDRITNALRGFNMEINEANADNIADVYSKLAAISASNVDEISTAMTKVASLANSANMSFENTAAFLAQIIETTRESAETAGTALKTVVARFSEVKDLYSKGELLGTDEEGEEVDVNKVSKALRTAGINLNEFLVGNEGLDEIFMELASKWKDLDIVQQRYIATMAAGSRQQSRFIALMSDYQRTQELTTAAQNASGASLEQYNKTLESLETKLNRLKNAWNEFIMSIANSDLIKGAVDMLTNLIGTLNKITDAISGGRGILKSISAIAIAVGGLKLGRGIFNTFFGNPQLGGQTIIGQLLTSIRGQSNAFTAAGAQAGASFNKGFLSVFSMAKNSGQSLGTIIGRSFGFGGHGFSLTAKDLGISNIDLSGIQISSIGDKNSLVDSIFDNQWENIDKLSSAAQQNYFDLSQQFVDGTIDTNQYINSLKNLGITTGVTAEQANKAGLSFSGASQSLSTWRISMMGAGAALLGLGTIIEKITGNSNMLTKILKNVGTALMGLGTILPLVSNAFKVFGKEVTTTIASIPIVGWIAIIISALVTLITVLSELTETNKERAKSTEEAFNNATDAANEAKEAYNNLSSSIEKLAEQETNIEKLSRGTEIWKDTVQEHNRAVMELIASYKELNVVSRGGVLSITNADQVERLYEQYAQDAALAAAGTNVQAQQAKYENSIYGNVPVIEDRERIVRAIGAGNLAPDAESIVKFIEDNGLSSHWASIFKKEYSLGFENSIKDEIEEIVEQSKEMSSLTQTIKNYNTMMANAIISQANLNNEEYNYADTLESNSAGIIEQYEQHYAQFTYQNTLKRAIAGYRSSMIGLPTTYTDAELEQLYKDYIKETVGIDSIYIDKNGNFKDQNNRERDFREFAPGFVSYLAKQELAPAYKLLASTLADFSNSEADVEKQRIAKVFSQSGESLTIEDLKALAGESRDIYSIDEKTIREIAEEFYNRYGGEEAFGNLELFLKSFQENYLTAANAYRNAGAEDVSSSLNKFSSGTVAAFTKSFGSYTQDLEAFTDDFFGQLEKAGFTELEDQEKIIKAIGSTDLSSQQDIKQISTILKDQGIDIATEEWETFINYIIQTTGALNKINLNNFKENAEDIRKIIDNLGSGSQGRTFSTDEYNKIKDYVNPEDFEMSAYGAVYVGDDFENLGKQIQEAIGQGFEDVQKVLQTKINLDKVYENAKEAGDAAGEAARKEWENQNAEVIDYLYRAGAQEGVESTLNQVEQEASQRATLNALVRSLEQSGELQNLEIPELINLTEDEINKLQMPKVIELLGKIQNIIDEKLINQSTYDTNEIDAALESGVGRLLVNWDPNDSIKLIGYREAITRLGLSEEITKEILKGFEDASVKELWSRYNAAEQLAAIDKENKEKKITYDSEEVKAYADELVRVGKVSKDNYDQAVKMANQQIKVNTATKKLIDTYKDWSKLFGEDSPLGKEKDFELSSEQFKVFDEMKKALQDSLDLEVDLSDEFFKSAKNAELLKTMMTGTVEEQKAAYQEIGKNATIDILLNMDPANEEIKSFQDSLRTLDLDTLTIEALVDMPGFQASLRTMMRYGGEAGRATAQAIANAMHLVPKIKPTGKRVYAGFNIPKEAGLNVDSQGYIETFEISWEPADFTPPDFPTLGGADTNKTSGSSSKPKQWKNPYDELYNKQQEINTALRERERLEHKYQDMLEDHTKTSEDLVKNNLAQIASLKRQIQLQQQLLKGRQRQLANVANETYEDSEGNRTTYAAMGVMRYVTYDEETREINIDWNELNKITDENLGGAIEAYVSRLEELLSAQNEIEDTIEELNDTVDEINKRGREEYLDFEQSVYDAIVGEREAEIEALENVSQTIKDAADKTIQSVQDEINKERQLRENEKEEQSILDKQMRLAYLRRDTSGANALEIKKLEEELTNDTQSYQDKIIDQTIQQMQDDAAKAAEQREQQIDLLRQSLEIDKATGEIWNKVNEYIAGGVDKDGSLIKGSKLEKLLKESADYTGMSRFGKENWDDDMAKKIAQAMMGVQSWELKEGKESGKLTLGDDNHTVLRYNPKKGTWYNTRTGESYTDDDLEYDYSKGKMVLKSKTSDQSQTSETTKSGPHKVVANGVPTEMYDVNDGHVAWTTAGGEQFDLVSEDGEDYIVANEQGARYRTRKKGWKKENGYVWNAYAQGGLVDTTGPAWLDGSKSRPEMVLDAADTRNLITLKNVLASILNNAKSSNANQMGGDNYFNIDIQAEIDSDYDVDQLADRIKKQIYDDASYRNVNVISTMR